MQKFLISNKDINGNNAIITGQDARHITKVLRMRPNDKILFTNGQGKDFNSTITKISPEEVRLAIKKSYNSKSESPARITLFQGMLKDNKMDTLVKHLTELGISAWTPLFCERAIPKPDKKRIDSRIKRWEKIAIEALKQCNRSVLPKINRPVTFSDMIKDTAVCDLKIAFWENATIPISKLTGLDKKTNTIKKISILIGPEGGLTKNEIMLAENAEFKTYLMGPRILRAETASITACSLIQHYFGDI